MCFIKQMQIKNEEKLKQNKRMKLLDQHQKLTLKKELVALDMQAEKLLFLLVVVLLMDQKVSQIIKKEDLIRAKKN